MTAHTRRRQWRRARMAKAYGVERMALRARDDADMALAGRWGDVTPGVADYARRREEDADIIVRVYLGGRDPEVCPADCAERHFHMSATDREAGFRRLSEVPDAAE